MCYPNPCQHDGICIPSKNGTATECECQDGYFGENCELGNSYLKNCEK